MHTCTYIRSINTHYILYIVVQKKQVRVIFIRTAQGTLAMHVEKEKFTIDLYV